ncbi:hypothetical protein LX64_03424 [Chitinophaga skermanii]|uniref:Sugar-phosphatase n=1 Tax=Chitinophaga skermanii TaxID=331697 RepID=A0A327QDM2_9BACT|nr:HAD family hydrolase [Chitinophaga skermanii]RAJ02411.1 hypothetical protein LX64_03424 [Chitinophaga skermanii]
MDLSAVKLVVTDMDGTLLHSNGKMSSDFLPLFEKMKAHQVQFSAASGRQFYNLLNQFPTIKNDMYFIAENGSYVVFQDRELLVQSLPAEIVRELVMKARTIPQVHIILCGKKQAYIDSTAPEFMVHVEKYYDRRLLVEDLLEVQDDEFLKIAICDLGGSEGNSYPHFKHLENELQVKVSGSIWLDLSHKLANKGRALHVLQTALGISDKETMVFGDYLNDLEMMEQAYFSFAMENAHPQIKEIARFTTKTNDEDGVVSVLNNLVAQIEN